MGAIRTFGWSSLLLALGVLPASTSLAGPSTGAACGIGKFVSSTSVFYYDVSGNGLWGGIAGGDASLVLAASEGAGGGFLGDFNGDGIDDGAKQVGTKFQYDKNGNRVWDGNAGGDNNRDFGPGLGTGTPLSFNNGGPEVAGRYIAGTSTFHIDLNGNSQWNGNAGGDLGAAFAASFGAGVGVVADFNGDGDDDIARVVGADWYIDQNDNNAWNGAAGGDLKRTFLGSVQPYTPITGDWDGDGDDDLGAFANGTHYLDLNGNGVWDGVAGGDVSVNFAGGVIGTGGSPLVCDFDGDGDDDIGKVVDDKYAVDLNGNLAWNGAAGGDRQSRFAIGGFGAGITPLAGVWATP
jgi:hypothetical protein